MAGLSQWILTVSLLFFSLSLFISLSFPHTHQHQGSPPPLASTPPTTPCPIQPTLVHNRYCYTQTHTFRMMTSLTKTGLTVYTLYPCIIRHSAVGKKKIIKTECFCSSDESGCINKGVSAEGRGGRILRRNGWENESS